MSWYTWQAYRHNLWSEGQWEDHVTYKPAQHVLGSLAPGQALQKEQTFQKQTTIPICTVSVLLNARLINF